MTGFPAPYFATPSDTIRHIRKAKRIAIVKLVERMGVSRTYIARLEREEIYAVIRN